MNRRKLVLPVEIQNREMLPKIYLGVLAAIKGFDIIIGDQKEIVQNIHRFNPGVYLDKSVAKTKVDFFKKLRRLGFTPIALCEEGLVYRDTERYLSERLDPEALKLVDMFFCWGEKQKRDIADLFGGFEKLKVIGNPRLDMLRTECKGLWEEETANIRQRVGKFLLINTNFSRANPIAGSDHVIDILKRRGTYDPKKSKEFYTGLVDHLELLMQEFIELIPLIASSLPEYNIVIRPHPGESTAIYDGLAEKINNVRVDYSGNVIPWLLAADVIIHNSCTTAMEGWVLGRPVVSYMPIENEHFDSELPNTLSYKAKKPSEMVNLIQELVKNPIPKNNKSINSIVNKYLCGLNGAGSCDRLIENLPINTKTKRFFISFEYSLIVNLKTIIRSIPGLTLPENLRYLGKKKFPGLDEKDAKHFLELIQFENPELRAVSIKKLTGYKNIFCITTKE